MKICVVGAGAVGGMLAVRLANTGAEVCVVDQGEHLQAMQRNGLRLILKDGSQILSRNIKFAQTSTELEISDIIILGVKAHEIESVASELPNLYGSRSIVITVQNGIPWWYFQNHGGEFDGTRLNTLDPHGIIMEHIPASRVIGGVAYPGCEVLEPGVIHLIEGNRFAFGELERRITSRSKRVSNLFCAAGFKSYALEDIRTEIWLKAWGALAFNPISALTRATMEEICQCTSTRNLAACMMKEAKEVATRLGIAFRHSIDKRINEGELVGAHKTSMLQDVEAGRSLEIGAVTGSVLELAKLTHTDCPIISAVYSCLELLDRTIKTNDLNSKSQIQVLAPISML